MTGAVVVTGASSGLGRQAVLTLARKGHVVVAGVRRLPDGESVAAEAPAGSVIPVHLDVTDEASLVLAAKTVGERAGGAKALVNNAGICVSAPVECVPADRLRDQLETNVLGQVAVTQAFLPQLREARGRVVNVTSGLGSLVVPYLGPYAMAQFAKEAMSDALRRELAPWGISVSVVQPGAILTPIWGKLADTSGSVLDGSPRGGHYRVPFERFLKANEAGARASTTSANDFAEAVLHALTARRPRTRYRVGKDSRAAARLARLLPDRLLDRRFTALTRP